MDYEWDETKTARNLAWDGVPFEAIVRFEWEGARIRQDTRREWRAEVHRLRPHRRPPVLSGFHTTQIEHPRHQPAQGEPQRDLPI